MNFDIFKYLVLGVLLIEGIMTIFIINIYTDNAWKLIKELFNIYKYTIYSNFLKLYPHIIKTSLVRNLIIVGLLVLLPFIYFIFILDNWGINLLITLTTKIVSLFELKNVILLFFTIATLIIMVFPIIHKSTRDFWIKHEYAISKSKNKLIALAFYSFCSSMYFALLFPSLSSLFFALTCIIILSLYVPPYLNTLDFQYNIRKTTFLIFEMRCRKTRKNKNMFTKHLSSILLDIDMRLPTPLKLDNIKVPTNNCYNISNKILLQTYLPLYVADATEYQRKSLKRKIEKIDTLFSEMSYNNIMVLREEISGLIKLIDKFVSERNIEIKDTNNTIDLLLIHLFSTNKINPIIILIVMSLCIFVINIFVPITVNQYITDNNISIVDSINFLK